MDSPQAFFATCPKGLESLLADELRALGAGTVKETRAGVAFSGDLATAYRACLWSRLASRVLLPLARFPAPTPEALYTGVQQIIWRDHVTPDGTLAVDCATVQSAVNHSYYAALKVKDAIVDQLRDRFGVRPSVDTERPDLRVNLYLYRDEATISLDLSGESLHRRGYRAQPVEAPLKENLAAAILLRADWPAIARGGGALVDLMCGSGTLPIEAALMAADIAPGLLRPYYGFLKWPQHDAAMWSALLAEAHERREAGLKNLPPIHGYDHDARAIRAAKDNIVGAGLPNLIHVRQRELSACEPVEKSGLVIANPPYGERLGEARDLPALYATLGDALKRCFPGWHAAVFTGNPELGKHLGLRAQRMHKLYNGAIECKLLRFDITEQWFLRERAPITDPAKLGAGAEMFANRLRKDWKHFGRWAKRQEIACYRLYDADLHEYNLAIDVYEGEKRWVHVQEYEAPDTVEERTAQKRLQQALTVIPLVLEIPPEQIFFKVRRRQKGRTQYEKLATTGEFHEVREGPCRLLVNFTDYLDTGLFLDHRLTRTLLGELAKDKRFLNLFGYTGSATAHAALGGARSTTTVDMSWTYLDWARRNLELNGVQGPKHELIQADVLKWLKEPRSQEYDLIFLDPPTFSRSKRMDDTLDVQRDHVGLIRDTLALLAPGGVLIFSTNLRKFKLDREALAGLKIDDITRRTIPPDFERNPRIHQCFRITRSIA